MAWTAGSVAGGRGRTGGGDGGGGGGVGAMVARPPPSPPSSVGSSVAFSSPSPHHIAKTQQNSRGFEAALQRPPTLRYDYHHNQHNIKSAAPVTRRVNEEDYVVEDDDSVAIGDNTASTIPSFKGVIVIDANPGNRWNTLAYSAPMKQGITFDNRLFESLAELIRATPSTMRKLRRHSAHWDATLRILLDTKIDADPSLAALLMKTVGWRLLVAPGDYARCGFADEETEGCARLSNALMEARERVARRMGRALKAKPSPTAGSETRADPGRTVEEKRDVRDVTNSTQKRSKQAWNGQKLNESRGKSSEDRGGNERNGTHRSEVERKASSDQRGRHSREIPTKRRSVELRNSYSDEEDADAYASLVGGGEYSKQTHGYYSQSTEDSPRSKGWNPSDYERRKPVRAFDDKETQDLRTLNHSTGSAYLQGGKKAFLSPTWPTTNSPAPPTPQPQRRQDQHPDRSEPPYRENLRETRPTTYALSYKGGQSLKPSTRSDSKAKDMLRKHSEETVNMHNQEKSTREEKAKKTKSQTDLRTHQGQSRSTSPAAAHRGIPKAYASRRIDNGQLLHSNGGPGKTPSPSRGKAPSSFDAWASSRCHENQPALGATGEINWKKLHQDLPVVGADTIAGRPRSWPWPSQPQFMSSYQQAFQDPHLRNESQSRQSNWESKLSPDENWSVEENSKEYGRGNEGSRALVLTSAPTRSKGATKSKSEPTSPASKTGRSGKSDGSSHHRPQSPRNGSSAPRHQVNQPAERRSSCPRLLVTPTDPIFGGLAATNVRRPPVTIDGRPYSTLEHYYHAMKFSATNPDLARKFQAGSASDPPLSAAQARRLAWRNGDLVREDWEGQCRVAVMRRGLEQLLRQEAGALTALVRGTIGREIIVEEDSSGTEDEFAIELGAGDGWARAQESREVEYWYGRANRYGRLLMALRDGLAQTRDL